jgi:hypothetical protein
MGWERIGGNPLSAGDLQWGRIGFSRPEISTGLAQEAICLIEGRYLTVIDWNLPGDS